MLSSGVNEDRVTICGFIMDAHRYDSINCATVCVFTACQLLPASQLTGNRFILPKCTKMNGSLS